MKIARRTLNNVWTYPLTQRDVDLNQKLRAEGLALDARMPK